MNNLQRNLPNLYGIRFSSSERQRKEKMWATLCSHFIQKFIPENATIIDLAAGYCEFLNHIQGKHKIAIDINPETKFFANQDVKFIQTSILKLPHTLNKSADVVFCSCLLEHLPTKSDVLRVFQQVYQVLKPDGLFIILNPNIRFSTSDYWDYFDHQIPISDRSVVEGLKLAGFNIKKVIPKFVPNTIKDRLPKSPLLLKIYLSLPILFPIFGRQMFIVASKPKKSHQLASHRKR